MAKKLTKEERNAQLDGKDGDFHAELKGMVMEMEEDHTKFYEKQNTAAGRRLRKTLQLIRKNCKLWREGIQMTIADLKK